MKEGSGGNGNEMMMRWEKEIRWGEIMEDRRG